MFTATSLKNVYYLDALIVSGIGSGRDLFPEMPTETCVGVYRARYSYYLIGASLSEPYTSGTSLRRCVCIQPTDRPYTVNFKCVFKYFSKIELPRSLAWQCAGLLSECSVGNRSGDGSRV